MSIRFTEDLEFRAPDAEPPIHFVGVLRRHLKVVDSPREDAAAAIREWLQSHEPSKTLIRDLEQSDFADTLDALG